MECSGHLAKEELGLAHDLQQRCSLVIQVLVTTTEENELPLLCRLLGP